MSISAERIGLAELAMLLAARVLTKDGKLLFSSSQIEDILTQHGVSVAQSAISSSLRRLEKKGLLAEVIKSAGISDPGRGVSFTLTEAGKGETSRLFQMLNQLWTKGSP